MQTNTRGLHGAQYFLEVFNRSVNQEMPYILRNSEIYCHVYTTQLLDSIPSQINQDQILTSYSSKIHLNSVACSAVAMQQSREGICVAW
jgi:hypothetical protein